MTRYDWLTLGLNVFSAIILPITLWVLRTMVRQARALRENELKHLDERLARVEAGGVRLERKLDDHLTFHAERPWGG